MIAPERLSRFLSYLLRHRPTEYPLVFDRHGFVAWADVVELVKERYDDAREEDIRAVVTEAEKKRFELRDDKVRATYGHSFPVDLGLEPVQPPLELYHGTSRDLAQSILRSGLKPRDRRYIHLLYNRRYSNPLSNSFVSNFTLFCYLLFLYTLSLSIHCYLIVCLMLKLTS